MQPLKIGDKSGWHFVNGVWEDGDDGLFVLPDETRAIEGDGMQALHFAFNTQRSFRDIHATFEFFLTGHSDAGLLLRAIDESHFYLLHFPNCGQGSRAQHFWAALSKMDGNGHLKFIKLAMVNRVPSNSGIWLQADVRVSGRRLTAQIGRHGTFEAVLDDARAGSTGFYIFGNAGIRNAACEGPIAHASWNSNVRQARNWFQPFPDTKYGLWQKPRNFVRLNESEILLQYGVQERPYEGKVTHLLARSRDNGRSWTEPELLPDPGTQYKAPLLHKTSNGTLLCLLTGREGMARCESQDGGRSWSEPVPSRLPPPPPGLPWFALGGPQEPLNLSDGSMLMFAQAGHPTSGPSSAIAAWGAVHCQAFVCRSEDEGRSWSDPVNLDSTMIEKNEPAYSGNLDLTEACASQMSDGSILALIRPVYSPWMWETWSYDNGRSWTPCVRGPFPGYATSNMVRTASGQLIVGHRMPCLTVHCSPDEGHTWDQGTMIDSGLWALGAMLEVEPDLVLYIYWDTRMSFMRTQYLKVTDDGVTPRRYWN